MTHRATSAAMLMTVVLATGCAPRPRVIPSTQPQASTPIAQQTLAQLQPPVSLPAPATQPSTPAPPEALHLYAQGRDALLQNQKKLAVDKLMAAVAIDPSSAVVHRDLGYAWLGADNDRALAAYQRAVELDPSDQDSRIQAARLLASRKDLAGAILQMRVARLTNDYQADPAAAALVDALLGHLLSQAGYAMAALECYEHVLPVLEQQPRALRNVPELAELAAQPAKLRLRIADLSVDAGRYDRAIGLYEQLEKDEPSAAAGMKLRVARTLAAKGDLDNAAARVIDLVRQFEASRPSVQAYIDLFEARGGDEAALARLDAHGAGTGDLTAETVLRARLLRRLDRPAQAVKLFQPATHRATVPYVREMVLSLNDAGRGGEVPRRLLTLMNEQPAAWSSIVRGWSMLSQPLQPSPLTAQAMEKMALPDELDAARLFVTAHLLAGHGQPVHAKRSLQAALQREPERTRGWLASPPIDPMPDLDPASERDLGLFIEEFSDDPEYLEGGTVLAIKQGQKQHLLNALHAAVQRRPSNLAAVSQLVAILSLDEQKVEALRVIEQAAGQVRSASELYQLSGMASQAGDPEGAERLLRRAHTADTTHPPSCNDLGYLLADSGRELDFAEDLLNRAVAAEPENPAYVDSLGWLLYKRQKFAEASQYLERALQASDPADPVVLDHAADAAYRIDQKDKARAHWQQAIESLQQRDHSDRPLRLKIDKKLQQIKAGQKVDVAPAGQ